MTNSNDTSGNRNRDLPACSAVPNALRHRVPPLTYVFNTVGRDSVVDITTRYRLEDLGIESREGQVFPHPSRLTLGPTHHAVQWVPCRLPMGKAT